jgi:hypothetical protein
MRAAVVALFAAIIAAGCGGLPRTPQGKEATPADVGPFPTNHQALFAAYLTSTLKDPYSAQVQHLAGPAQWVKPSSWGSSVSTYGWGACYAVNAKNSFGGYTGARWYVAVYRDDRLVTVIGPSGRNTMQEDAVISTFCRSAGAPVG